MNRRSVAGTLNNGSPLATLASRRKYAVLTAETLEKMAKAMSDLAKELRKDPDQVLRSAYIPTNPRMDSGATVAAEITYFNSFPFFSDVTVRSVISDKGDQAAFRARLFNNAIAYGHEFHT